jgi:hypothetical protein
MTKSGRPLRFLIAISAVWIGGRVVALWPAEPASFVTPERPLTDIPVRVAGGGSGSFPPFFPNLEPAILPNRPAQPFLAAGIARLSAGLRPAIFVRPMVLPKRDPTRIMLAMLSLSRFGTPVAQPGNLAVLASPATDPQRLAAKALPGTTRWSASGWVFWRDGSDLAMRGFAPQPALGGSQAGLRVGYAIDPARRLTLFGRFSAPLSAPGREVAVGADWRPTALPVRLIAEQRIGLDSGVRGGTTLGAVGGIGPVVVFDRVSLEGYGQTGVILRDGGVGFADGSLRLRRRIARVGPVDITVGGGSWGGIQPGVSRLDVGPTLGVDLPVARHTLRLSVDWRERVVGNAAPSSGLAVTLGADF